MSQLLRKRPPPKSSKKPEQKALEAQESIEARQHQYVLPERVAKGNTSAEGLLEEPKFRCRYHLGSYSKEARVWTCCNQPSVPSTEPCGGAHEHVPREQDLNELTMLYQCYHTPLSPPKRSDIYHAVALDCEMGQAANGDSELIRVTLIDYFSEAILIDNLVEPEVELAHLNTRYSGVTWADMKKARRDRTILRGKAAARQAVWRYVGPDTVVIGHGLENDLRSLRWIHSLIVDSLVTESIRRKLKEKEEAKVVEALQAVEALEIAEEASNITATAKKDSNDLVKTKPAVLGKPAEKRPMRKPGILSLKTLAKSKLSRDIQNKGKAGHDSLEDAIAARDLVHLNVLELMGRQ
jgi:RNA exonuclease 1